MANVSNNMSLSHVKSSHNSNEFLEKMYKKYYLYKVRCVVMAITSDFIAFVLSIQWCVYRH